MNFKRLPHAARVVLLARAGGRCLTASTSSSPGSALDGVSPEHVFAEVIKSKGSFHADHFSAMRTTPRRSGSSGGG